MAERTPIDPAHMANTVSLAMDLATVLTDAGATSADVEALTDVAWSLAYRIARGPVRGVRAWVPSDSAREATRTVMARREAEATADPFRGFPS